MARSRSPERQRELDELLSVLRVLTSFKRSVLAEEGQEWDSIGRMFEDSVEDAYTAGSLLGLRMAYNDLVEMAQSYNASQLRQLDRRLVAEAGTSLQQLFEKRNVRIQEVRKRGRIASDTQYYLVREYFEFIWDNPAHADEARDLQRLMLEYEERKGRAAKEKRGRTGLS